MLIFLMSITIGVNAKANITELTAVEYDCLVDMGMEPRMDGNILQIRDIVHVNVDVSNAPELDGLNKTIADAEFNSMTGGAIIRGTLSFQPNTIDGTWEGTWVFVGTKGKGVAQAVAQGTGELAGKKLFLKLYDAEPDDPR
jgi:hypothetical protein